MSLSLPSGAARPVQPLRAGWGSVEHTGYGLRLEALENALQRGQPLLSPEQLAELATAVRGPAPEGDIWVGRTVADWMSQKLGRPISVYVGWAYLVRLDGKRRKPRPRHVHANPAEQDAFKKSSGRSSRRSPALSPTRRSSSGRSTSTASA